MSALEQQVDELYQLPLSGFTSARNALAKTLKGETAARVKALAKPTAVPWAVNQLYWHGRSSYDRLASAGRALREVQIAALSGRRGDVAQANEAHRTALAEAVRDAVALAAAHGIAPSTDQLARMLEMLSLMPASAETPGRHTDLIQSSGLEVLAGITLAEATHEDGGRTPASDRFPAGTAMRLVAAVPNLGAERRRAEEASAARKQAQEKLHAAERALERARAVEEAAQRDLAKAEGALERAQQAVEVARRARRAANETLTAARTAAR